jgi:hypothetical protein
MIGTASTSETSVNFYQTAQHNKPEYIHLHTRRREKVKFHLFSFNFACQTFFGVLQPGAYLGLVRKMQRGTRYRRTETDTVVKKTILIFHM